MILVLGLALVALFTASLSAATRSVYDDRVSIRTARPDFTVPDVPGDDDEDEGEEMKACSESAKAAFKSCKDEVKGEFWLSYGKCLNIADGEEREECQEEAEEVREEERDLCDDQLEARREICGELGEAPYDPEIVPADFVEGIDNPFLPYAAGTTWIYEGETEEGLERIVVEVTGDTREIMDVECTVVRDRVYLDDELIEDTLDWYAQDVEGNVWYFGEITFEIEDGEIANLEGSWEAGEDGAEPGIVMQAYPVVGDYYRQEMLLGEAEDMGEVVGVDESVSVEYGDFDGCVKTRDFTPIEPDALEFKYYAPGIGFVLEEKPEEEIRIELIEMTVN
jgi:hypothetical protein